eukprot:1892635-Prymnesium_polylepis.1
MWGETRSRSVRGGGGAHGSAALTSWRKVGTSRFGRVRGGMRRKSGKRGGGGGGGVEVAARTHTHTHNSA